MDQWTEMEQLQRIQGVVDSVTFRNEQLRKYFPRSYTTQQMQDTIIKLLDQWQKKKARDQER